MHEYLEGDIIGVPSKSNTQYNPPVFMNSSTTPPIGAAHNTWTTIDLTGIVPPGTKAVRLDGVLIITHGNSTETANLKVHFRKGGETDEYNYNMQVIETQVGGGQRSTAGVWIALDDNLCFQYKWATDYLGAYPTYSGYAINLSLTAYVRKSTVSLEALNTSITDILARLEALEVTPQSEDQRMTGLIDYVKTL